MATNNDRPYRKLDPGAIVSTVDALALRIEEGFPGSGLGAVCGELKHVAREVEELTGWLARPLTWARVAVGAGLVLLLAGLFGAVFRIRVSLQVPALPDLLQGVDSGINDVVFIGLAVFFLFTIEARVKRRRALESLHTLRSLAHIIDMHQLKKDPEPLASRLAEPGAGPPLAADALARYLDHCGDMLALISKLAALHAQEFADAPTLAVVQEVEDLAHDLLRNIWQKIVIVDRLHVA